MQSAKEMWKSIVAGERRSSRVEPFVPLQELSYVELRELVAAYCRREEERKQRQCINSEISHQEVSVDVQLDPNAAPYYPSWINK